MFYVLVFNIFVMLAPYVCFRLKYSIGDPRQYDNIQI